MVLSAGIKRLLLFLILDLISVLNLFWNSHFAVSLNVMLWMRFNMPSSKGISSLIFDGELCDLNPYVSFVAVSVWLRKW